MKKTRRTLTPLLVLGALALAGCAAPTARQDARVDRREDAAQRTENRVTTRQDNRYDRRADRQERVEGRYGY